MSVANSFNKQSKELNSLKVLVQELETTKATLVKSETNDLG